MVDSEIDIKEAVKQLMQINHIEKIALKDLVLKKKIGEGGQAKVYRGTFNGEVVAVKVLEDIDYKCFAHEIVIIANLKHENIPKFYGIVAEEKVLSLVFQYINGKTLDEFKPKDLDEKLKLYIIKTLGQVLALLHSNKFIHRDLKPENLMLDNTGKIYLIDFGIAKVCTQDSDFTDTKAKGTLHYLAPECLQVESLGEGDQIISRISTKVDVWAFGCIVSWLFSGYLPWCDTYPDNAAILQDVLTKKKNFSIPKTIKNEFIVNLIKMATVVDPEQRATMEQINEYIANGLK
jgi:serine/threonine protein kinase